MKTYSSRPQKQNQDSEKGHNKASLLFLLTCLFFFLLVKTEIQVWSTNEENELHIED